MPNQKIVDAKFRMTNALVEALTEGAPGYVPGSRIGLVVSAGDALDDAHRRAVSGAAAGAGVDGVHAVFPGKATDRIRTATVFVVEGGLERMFDDCALWRGETGGPVLIVVRGDERAHFALEGARLTRRAGWPAERLGPGMVRAEAAIRRRFAGAGGAAAT